MAPPLDRHFEMTGACGANRFRSARPFGFDLISCPPPGNAHGPRWPQSCCFRSGLAAGARPEETTCFLTQAWELVLGVRGRDWRCKA